MRRVVKVRPGRYRVVGRTSFRGRPARRLEDESGTDYLMLASHWTLLRDLGVVRRGD